MHDAVRIPEGFEFLERLYILGHQRLHRRPVDEGVRTVV